MVYKIFGTYDLLLRYDQSYQLNGHDGCRIRNMAGIFNQSSDKNLYSVYKTNIDHFLFVAWLTLFPQDDLKTMTEEKYYSSFLLTMCRIIVPC